MDEIDESNLDYREQAQFFKEKGDEAFKANDIEGAIRFFTQAIDIDPDNHIFYSNRAAAYMKADSVSKALHDAEKCVELAPNWAKGFNRLGVALERLRRFDQAIDTLKKGIELEPNNRNLWDALKHCEEGYEADKKARFAEAAKEREEEEKRMQLRETVKQDMLRKKEELEAESLLHDFFSDVGMKSTATTTTSTSNNQHNEQQTRPTATSSSSSSSQLPQPENKTTTVQQSNEDNLFLEFMNQVEDISKPKIAAESLEHDKEEKEVEKPLTEKYLNQDLGTGQSQCERLLGKHYEWKNLNPFSVLDLDSDATEDDIKYRYKKLSLKVHPDRLRHIENARTAFEEVKNAYNRLMDADQRKTIVMHIENVTLDLQKERRKQIAKGIREIELPNYEEERKIRIMKHFADMENMKRLSEKNLRNYSAREKMQEVQEEEKVRYSDTSRYIYFSNNMSSI
jgi:DnaJ homolog subfamily C member 8